MVKHRASGINPSKKSLVPSRSRICTPFSLVEMRLNSGQWNCDDDVDVGILKKIYTFTCLNRMSGVDVLFIGLD
jgi:hypothetical protein